MLVNCHNVGKNCFEHECIPRVFQVSFRADPLEKLKPFEFMLSHGFYVSDFLSNSI
jgi:hypothetical protein